MFTTLITFKFCIAVFPATSIALSENRDPPFYWGTTLTLTCVVNYDTQLVDVPVSFNISIIGPNTNAIYITSRNKSNTTFVPLLPIHNGTYTCLSYILPYSSSTFVTPSTTVVSTPLDLQLTGK